MSEHHAPCPGLMELRVKTETELALLGQSMTQATDALNGSAERLEHAAQLLNDIQIEIAKQNEQMSAGSKKFALHEKFMLFIGGGLLAVTLTMVSLHGSSALKLILN